jgi:hypothetical protein
LRFKLLNWLQTCNLNSANDYCLISFKSFNGIQHSIASCQWETTYWDSINRIEIYIKLISTDSNIVEIHTKLDKLSWNPKLNEFLMNLMNGIDI